MLDNPNKSVPNCANPECISLPSKLDVFVEDVENMWIACLDAVQEKDGSL
jgi:hypothetical protein